MARAGWGEKERNLALDNLLKLSALVQWNNTKNVLRINRFITSNMFMVMEAVSNHFQWDVN